MAKATNKVPAVNEKAALPTTNTDDDFAAYAGAGLENITSSDLLVPRLVILQALSPQVKRSKGEYIEGAEPGIIADVGTGEIFPDGVWFLPVLYKKEYLEWAPRESAKGLVTIHSDSSILDSTKKDDRGKNVLPNGNYIVDTAQFYGLNLSAGGRLCFIPMTSTQLKKSRRWNTLAAGEKLRRADGSEFTAPMFYRTYNLSTVEESNNDGEWSGWKVDRGIALPEISDEEHGMNWRSIKEAAVSFQESIVKGAARGDVSEEGASGGEASGGEESM